MLLHAVAALRLLPPKPQAAAPDVAFPAVAAAAGAVCACDPAALVGLGLPDAHPARPAAAAVAAVGALGCRYSFEVYLQFLNAAAGAAAGCHFLLPPLSKLPLLEGTFAGSFCFAPFGADDVDEAAADAWAGLTPADDAALCVGAPVVLPFGDSAASSPALAVVDSHVRKRFVLPLPSLGLGAAASVDPAVALVAAVSLAAAVALAAAGAAGATGAAGPPAAEPLLYLRLNALGRVS